MPFAIVEEFKVMVNIALCFLLRFKLGHHSDRGSQYASKEYRAKVEKYKMTCSMSRRGNKLLLLSLLSSIVRATIR